MVGVSSGSALLEFRVALRAAVPEVGLDFYPIEWLGLNGSR